jgi:hypothetical protein
MAVAAFHGSHSALFLGHWEARELKNAMRKMAWAGDVYAPRTVRACFSWHTVVLVHMRISIFG